MTQITKEDVAKLAELSRIEMNEVETEKLAGEIDGILGYIDQIKNAGAEYADGVGVGPHNVLRDDSNPHESGLHKAELIGQAPDNDAEYLKVKNIL